MDALGWMVSFTLAFYMFCVHARLRRLEGDVLKLQLARPCRCHVPAPRREYDPARFTTRN